jgi:hypothetical protein
MLRSGQKEKNIIVTKLQLWSICNCITTLLVLTILKVSTIYFVILRSNIQRASIEFPPCFLLFLLLYFFYLLIYYIQRESPERAASFGIFTLDIRCSLKYKKCIRKKNHIFLPQIPGVHNVVTFFISHISQLR